MADSPVPCTPITSNLATTVGGDLGGVLFGFMFYGANCLQIFVYLVNYPNDRMTLKALVASVWAADTAHQICNTIGIWQILVSNFGNYVVLEENQVPFLVALIFSIAVATMAQLFLTYRIWHLSGRMWIFPAFLIPAVVGKLVNDFMYVVKGLTNTSVQNLYDINGYATAGNALTAGIDIAITIIMCTLLTRARRGFNKRTDAMLVRLVILSVNSGLWTTVFAIVTAGLAIRNNLLLTWPQFCMSPLYCNTILGCLNARAFIHNGIHRDRGSTFQLGSVSTWHAGGAQRPFQSSVAVETKQTIETESLDGQTLQASSGLSHYRT
ncbi:hypothetical protein K503DRAFT_772469 [Rhizopogon vinicolor AM-OR11-026]|uniref:DUF6534 domain-containing protein n=1 Tax=Rhizopogon vinicolor AM-OR11-026 TaxID=1314800 RepID=A0A1B7MV21_9AGAM|nr:hypothetical protein K503DRAFT_772469 [Rhizopogon vinicolor AM-OR11-026]